MKILDVELEDVEYRQLAVWWNNVVNTHYSSKMADVAIGIANKYGWSHDKLREVAKECYEQLTAPI
jgi:hypothetical protein